MEECVFPIGEVLLLRKWLQLRPRILLEDQWNHIRGSMASHQTILAHLLEVELLTLLEVVFGLEWDVFGWLLFHDYRLKIINV